MYPGMHVLAYAMSCGPGGLVALDPPIEHEIQLEAALDLIDDDLRRVGRDETEWGGWVVQPSPGSAFEGVSVDQVIAELRLQTQPMEPQEQRFVIRQYRCTENGPVDHRVGYFGVRILPLVGTNDYAPEIEHEPSIVTWIDLKSDDK